ncbi:hypothetical protein [Labrenzia sp. DG1229]|nr:hypothetical protein [Labrenzia sp. DG1229]
MDRAAETCKPLLHETTLNIRFFWREEPGIAGPLNPTLYAMLLRHQHGVR